MIFIDTGAFLSRYIASDQYHRTAKSLWKKAEQASLVTSNHVLDETLTLLARRAGYDFAAARAENIYASKQLKILHSQKEDELRALEYFRKFSDQEVSFTDAISFSLMKKHSIRRVFTFDHHFHLLKFEFFS